MTNINSLGAIYVTSKNPKTEKPILLGLEFTKLLASNAAGVQVPLFIAKKAVDRIAGQLAVYNQTLNERDADHKQATFSLMAEKMVAGLSAIIPAEVGSESFVNYTVRAMESWKPQSTRNPEGAAFGQFGRAIPFSVIVAGGPNLTNAVQDELEATRKHLAAMEKVGANISALQEKLIDYATTNGVDVSKDRVKFREITD